jgi:hypothetical protein
MFAGRAIDADIISFSRVLDGFDRRRMVSATGPNSDSNGEYDR